MDLSVTKSWKFQERLTAQFRAESVNILNHPNFMNPYRASDGCGIGAEGDPSSTSNFGCGSATPDQAGGNPVLGSGGNCHEQLGLMLIFWFGCPGIYPVQNILRRIYRFKGKIAVWRELLKPHGPD